MPKTRTYSIIINGLEQSINQVETLNKQLDALESRIDKLSSKAVNITTSSSGGGGGKSSSELDQEAKLQKEIVSTLEKAATARSDEYQNLLKAKAELKEYQTIAKSINAQESLLTGANDLNTMAGMKAELRDIKQAMQTMDVDSEGFKILTQRAGELTSKLKELETAYGQWGRNVGNYTSAFDGLSEITVKVGDTERVFSSVREASRELGNELKAMVINGMEDTEQFKLLSDAVHDFEMATQRANSAVEDMKKSSTAMDDLLDTFESFGALGSIAGGMKAFLGFDDAEIQKSIQSLVALQNVLKGIETLNKQINTQEGIGKYLANSNKQIDQFIAKITGAQVAEKGLVASTTAGTVAVKAFSAALKGIGLGLLMGGITLAVQGIQKLVGAIQNWIKGNADLVKSEDMVKQSVERTNDALEERNKVLQQSYLRGAISEEEYLKRSAEATLQVLREQIALIEQINAKEVKQIFSGGAEDSTWGFDYDVKGLEEATKMLELFGRALEENKDIVSSMRDHWDELTDAEKRMAEVGSTSLATISDTKDEFAKLSQVVGGQLIQEYQNAMEVMAYDTKKGEEALRRLYEQLNDNKWMQAALFNLPQYIPNEQVAARMQGLVNIIRNGMNQIQTAANADLGQLMIDAMKDGLDKTLAQINRNEQLELQQYRGNQEAIKLVQKKYANQRAAATEAENKKHLSSVKKGNRDILEAEKQLTKLRIQNMAEGLSKRLTEIDAEYNIEYNAIKQRGERVNELLAELDKKRRNDRQKALDDYKKDTEEAYSKMYDTLFNLEQKTLERVRDTFEEYKKNRKYELEHQQAEILWNVQAFKYDTSDADPIMEGAARQQREYEAARGALERIGVQMDNIKARLKEINDLSGEERMNAQREYDILTQKLLLLEKEQTVTQALYDKGNVKGMGEYKGDIEGTYTVRLEAVRNFYANLEQLEKMHAVDETKVLKSNMQKEMDEEDKAHQERLDKAYEWYKRAVELAEQNGDDLTEVDKTYQNYLLQEDETYEMLRLHIGAEYQQKELALKRDEVEKTQALYADMYSSLIQEARDYTAAANEKASKADDMNVFSVKAIRKQRREAVSEYQHGIDKINDVRKNLSIDFQLGKINYKDYQQSLREIESESQNLTEGIKNQTGKLENGDDWGDLFSKIAEYANMAGQMTNDILSSVWDYQDKMHEKMMEDLNKAIEAQEEAYQKQQEITQQYAENVNSIEDELSNSRGARRQELIDQLNAQMEAQRASLAEEKRIEREKKALQKKADQEDQNQKNRQKRRDLTQAIINGALAVTNALTTKPFIPMGLIAAGIAAATSGVQIGLIKKAKYAKGGQLEGKSHAQGGIPVGNTGIEVEGKEYIVRKESTQPNIGLLDYINKSKRKLTLEDFIDYYDKPSKIRQNVSRMKFAEGGIMPNVETSTRRGSDEIIDAIDRLANRPYYVSVAEINNVQDRVGRVQALAGRE